MHTSSALTVAIAVLHPHRCLRAPAWVQHCIIRVLEAALCVPAQLRIPQSLFEGREGIVVAAAGRVMITGYTFCSRLDGLTGYLFLHTRTSSFDCAVPEAGCESRPIGYNLRLWLEIGLGLAGVLMPGPSFIVQWHCLVLRSGGCTRPAIVLLGSIALGFGTRIGRVPEIHTTHINNSHGKYSNFSKDSSDRCR